MTEKPDKRERIIAARQRLRERFLASPAERRGGSGEANRHGMPKLPPGQSETRKWPVLDLGVHPELSREQWQLEIKGLCASPLRIDFAELLTFEQVEEESDFHCVTAWSQMDLCFKGVRLIDILAAAEPDDRATHLMCYGSDGYCTNISLAEALKPDVLITYQVGGEALSKEHGGPVRMITPQLYAWKGAKWICAIELLDADAPGFWEKNGYSMTALPWIEDRYSREDGT